MWVIFVNLKEKKRLWHSEKVMEKSLVQGWFFSSQLSKVSAYSPTSQGLWICNRACVHGELRCLSDFFSPTHRTQSGSRMGSVYTPFETSFKEGSVMKSWIISYWSFTIILWCHCFVLFCVYFLVSVYLQFPPPLPNNKYWINKMNK